MEHSINPHPHIDLCMPLQDLADHRFPHSGEPKELTILRSSIHSRKGLYHQEGVKLDLRDCPEPPILAIRPNPPTPRMIIATKLRKIKSGVSFSKMTSDPLNGVLPASLSQPAHALSYPSIFVCPRSCRNYRKTDQDAQFINGKYDSLPTDSTIKVPLSY